MEEDIAAEAAVEVLEAAGPEVAAASAAADPVAASAEVRVPEDSGEVPVPVALEARIGIIARRVPTDLFGVPAGAGVRAMEDMAAVAAVLRQV